MGPRRDPPSEAPQIHRVILRSQVSISVPETPIESTENLRRAETLSSGQPLTTRSREPLITKSREPIITKSREPIITKSREPIITKNREPIITKSKELRPSKSREILGKSIETPITKSTEMITSKSKGTLSGSRETLISKSVNRDESAISINSTPNESKEEMYSVGRRITRAMNGMEILLPSPSLTSKSFKREKSSILSKYKDTCSKSKDEMHVRIDASETNSREEERNEKSAKRPRLTEREILTTWDSALTSETHSIALKNGVSNHRLTRLNSVKIKLLQQTENNVSDQIQIENSELKHENNNPDVTLERQLQEKIFPKTVGVLTRGKASAKESSIEEERLSLIETKDSEIKKSNKCDVLEPEQHRVELPDSPQNKSSVQSSEEEMCAQKNGEIYLTNIKQKKKEEECLHHADNILSSGIKKRGRPPGSKNKVRIEEKNVNITRKRGRPPGAGHRHRVGHASNHHNSIATAGNNLKKKVRGSGGLAKVIGKMKGRRRALEGLQDSIMRGKINETVRRNGIKESAETELLEVATTVKKKLGKLPQGGKGRWKGSVVMRGSVEAHDAAMCVREVRLMQSRLPKKRGRPPGGGKWKGSLTSSLALKRKKRMRMMNELEEPMEKLDCEDNAVAKRQKKMKDTVFMARKIRRNMTKKKKKLDDRHESKCSKNICSPERLSAKVTELKMDKGKSTVGHTASDDVIRFGENDVEAAHMAPASKVAEGNTMDMLKGNVNADLGSQFCLVAPSPMDTGGRQMRPRPLDLMQPLLTFIEGKDQEYYEFDGGSFYRMLQQQNEPVNCCIEKLKAHESNSEAVAGTGPKDKPIFLPAFRSREELGDNLQILYAIPDIYIKANPQNKARQAEYDMDEEDEEWLKICNESLSPSSAVSADQFERMIDLLENRAAKSNGYNSLFQSLEEDLSPNLEECCICNGGENAEDNPVFKCAACHILVHQSCYGIQDSIIDGKRGSWHCRKCQAVFEGREDAGISCALCHKQGGALKPSTEPHKWAHVVCALYTNETYFVNPDAMEPIDGLSAANARVKRQRRHCWLCGIKEGSVEKCSVPSCKAHFHVSCGVTEGASFELQHSNDQVISVRVYCPTHAFIASNSGARDGENDEFASYVENSLHTNGSHSNNAPRRRGRKRKNRIHKKNASGQGKGELSVVNHDKSAQEQCMNSNPDEFPIHVGPVKNVLGDDIIKEGNINHDVHPNACTVPELMDRIYLYWVSKREKYGGSLLHHIQQEHAAKKFGIFNAEDIEHVSINSPGDGDIEKMAVGSRTGPELFREITHLVAEREKLKLNIRSLNQDILKVTAEFLKARGSSGTCTQCNETGLSLTCTTCNRSTCFYCSMLKSGIKCDSNWLASLKKFECFQCLKKCQTQLPLSRERFTLLDKGNDRPGSSMSSELVRIVDNRKFGAHSSHPSLGKPYMVLPWLDFMHQHRLANEVPWKRSPPKRTISIANFLTVPKSCFIDVP